MNNPRNLVETFTRHLKVKGRSPLTIEEVIRRLGTFIDYLESKKITEIDAVTKDVIKEYQVTLHERINAQGKPNSISYQNFLLGAVKQFMRYLKKNDYLVSDPAESITYAKEPQRLPRSVLTPAETRKLMSMPDTKTVLGYRDRTIMEVLYSSGIRRMELHGLTLDDVDYDDGFLRVTGKGGKDRIVPLGAIACRYVETYIKSVRPHLVTDPSNRHLFLSQRGNRLSNWVMAGFMKKYAKQAKIKKRVHPHAFRHTCATAMLKNKANIRIVQELLGHRCISTTQIYTRITITDLKEVHKRCHPREKDRG